MANENDKQEPKIGSVCSTLSTDNEEEQQPASDSDKSLSIFKNSRPSLFVGICDSGRCVHVKDVCDIWSSDQSVT